MDVIAQALAMYATRCMQCDKTFTSFFMIIELAQINKLKRIRQQFAPQTYQLYSNFCPFDI